MRCAELRRARGLTQLDLAERVGVEQPTISRLERGNDAVTLRLLRDVAQALGVTVADLFLEERTPEEQEIVEAFRLLSEERQKGWLDMAQVLRGPAGA